ncbi:MAG: peptidoglycan-binding protein [Litoreibacter sp.]|nr:peptidoglycan-binding protein [Litoreibacter sp.]
MFLNRFTVACAAACLTLTPASRLSADTGDFVAGAVVGVVGSALVRNANKNKAQAPTKQVVRVVPYDSYTRAENREIQTSLNYFGFPAGVADGVMGRRSRAAASGYQSHMGYPATGQLTQYEKDFLLTSYRRALAGGAATTQQIAADLQGPRGLLHAYRDELAAGTQPATVPVTTEAAAPAPQPPASGGLPTFMGASSDQSLAAHCNQVTLVTSSNGGFTTSASMGDPNLALNEQFCLARSYAMSRGDEMITKIKSYTPQEIAEQCRGVGTAMQSYVASLSQKTQAEVLGEVSSFALGSGMAPDQLTGTSRICLSVGYSNDDMDIAIGSALLLTALGERAYGELMGHHLSQGFGVTRRPDLSLAWYNLALNALEAGATPVLGPSSEPDRMVVLRKATFSLAQGAQVPAQSAGGLPAFKAQP